MIKAPTNMSTEVALIEVLHKLLGKLEELRRDRDDSSRQF